MNKEVMWFIRWRGYSARDDFTPLTHIPIQHCYMKAKNKEKAVNKLYAEYPNEDRIRIESVDRAKDMDWTMK